MDAMAMRFAHVGVVFFLCVLHIHGTSSRLMITIRSSCADTIWPAIVSKPHSPELISENMTGFALRTGESKTISAPDNWAGTVWSRTHCKIDAAGKFTCGTGDCGSYAVECPGGGGGGGGGASVPAATTLADFTPNGGVGEYTYSVSLAKGFNLPVIVVPGGVESRSNSCRAAGCDADLNKECPKEVEVVLIGHNNSVIGCNSACEAFKESKDHYCGRASTYSDHFKGFCPNAQAFENDKTSNTTFECSSADYYVVHFCASSFPSTPPISEIWRASSPDGYEDIPGEKVSTDDSGRSPVVKILIWILGCVGSVVGLSFLGYTHWCRNDDSNNGLSFNISNYCCIICSCCNCFNSIRISAPPDAAPTVDSAHPHRGSSASNPDPQPKPRDKPKKKKEKSQDRDKEMEKRPPQDKHKEKNKEKSQDKDKEMEKKPPQDKHKQKKKAKTPR